MGFSDEPQSGSDYFVLRTKSSHAHTPEGGPLRARTETHGSFVEEPAAGGCVETVACPSPAPEENRFTSTLQAPLKKISMVDRGKYGSGRISTRKNSDDRQVLFKCTGGPSHLAFPPPHGPPPAADIMKATASHLRSSQVCLSAAKEGALYT